MADAVTFNDAIHILDLTGVFASAVLGGVAARTARLDVVGFIVLAVMSGLGGGMIRDLLLQTGGPVAAIADPAYLMSAVFGGTIAFFLTFNGRWARRGLLSLDALAVGCWSAAGVQKALEADLGWMAAIMLGITTAVGGGMVRDLMLLKVPTIFGGNTLYATSAVLASVEMLVFSELGLVAIGSIVAILSGAALSLLAKRYGWVLPTGYERGIPKPILLLNPRVWRARRFRERKRNDDLVGE